MKIFYLPESVLDLSLEALRERMRRHHWRRYFENLRLGDRTAAEYHRKLATSLEKHHERKP